MGTVLVAFCTWWWAAHGEQYVDPGTGFGMVFALMAGFGLALGGGLLASIEMSDASADDVLHYAHGASATTDAEVELVTSRERPKVRERRLRPLVVHRDGGEIATVPVPERHGGSNGSAAVLLHDGSAVRVDVTWFPTDTDTLIDIVAVITMGVVQDGPAPRPVARAVAHRGPVWQHVTRSGPRPRPSEWLDWTLDLPGHTFRLRASVRRIPTRRTLLDTDGRAWLLACFRSSPRLRATAPPDLGDSSIAFLLLLEILLIGLTRTEAGVLDPGPVDRPFLKNVLLRGWWTLIPPAN